MKPNEKDVVSGGEPEKATPESPPESPFQRFEEFARRVISVPKAEIDERERAYREGRKRSGQRSDGS